MPRPPLELPPAFARDLEALVIQLGFVFHNPSTLSSASSFCVLDRILVYQTSYAFLATHVCEIRSSIFGVPGTIEPADSWSCSRSLSVSPRFRLRVVDAASVLDNEASRVPRRPAPVALTLTPCASEARRSHAARARAPSTQPSRADLESLPVVMRFRQENKMEPNDNTFVDFPLPPKPRPGVPAKGVAWRLSAITRIAKACSVLGE